MLFDNRIGMDAMAGRSAMAIFRKKRKNGKGDVILHRFASAYRSAPVDKKVIDGALGKGKGATS